MVKHVSFLSVAQSLLFAYFFFIFIRLKYIVFGSYSLQVSKVSKLHGIFLTIDLLLWRYINVYIYVHNVVFNDSKLNYSGEIDSFSTQFFVTPTIRELMWVYKFKVKFTSRFAIVVPHLASRGGRWAEHSHTVRKTNVNIFATFVSRITHIHPLTRIPAGPSSWFHRRFSASVSCLRGSEVRSCFFYIFFLQFVRWCLACVWTCRREGSQNRSSWTPSLMGTLLTAPEAQSKWQLLSTDIKSEERSYLQRK